jgi:7-cyano-7-deazaguanine synthase
MRAVVLLSGGLDSTTTLGIALRSGRQCFPLGFDYGQRHQKELLSAREVAYHYLNTKYHSHPLQIVKIGGLYLSSALTSSTPVPTGRDDAEMARSIPPTYVPARNSIFLAMGMALAESLGADEVWTGFNAVDYSGYPDCRPEYAAAMQAAMALGTKRGVDGDPIQIKTPIIDMSKKVIINEALLIKAPLHLTWSCYLGGNRPCGACDSCLIRAKAFAEVGVKDPAL